MAFQDERTIEKGTKTKKICTKSTAWCAPAHGPWSHAHETTFLVVPCTPAAHFMHPAHEWWPLKVRKTQEGGVELCKLFLLF